MDKPISTPEPVPGNPRQGMPGPAEQRPQGTMSERRVSGQPPEAQFRPMRRSGGPVLVHRSLDSRHASTGAPIHGGDGERAGSIRVVLDEIDLHAALKLQSLSTQHGLIPPRSAQAAPLSPAKTEPAFDWCLAHRQLLDYQHHFFKTGRPDAAVPIKSCVYRIESRLRQRYADLGGKQEALHPLGRTNAPPRPQQQYRGLEEMARQADRAGDSAQSGRIRRALKTIDEGMIRDLRSLTRRYPPLNALLADAGLRIPPVAPAGTAQATVALPSAREHLPEPPGPGSRVMPNLAVSTPVPAARDRPLAHRQAIVERFRSDGAVFDAGVTLGSGAADALGWAATRVEKVLENIDRLNRFDGKDPAALADIDWSGIEALVRMMDTPPASPSTLPSASARSSPAV